MRDAKNSVSYSSISSADLLLQWLDRHFLEKYDVVVTVILQADPSEVRPWPALWFKVKFPLGDGITIFVIVDLYAVEHDEGARTVECDVHRVPLRTGLPRVLHQGLGQRIQHCGLVILVLAGGFGVIIDLHFETIMHRHPLFAGLDRNADEDTGIVVLIPHLVHHVQHAIADLAAGPVEQPHAAMRTDQAIFHRVSTWSDMFPVGEVFTIK